MDKISIYNTVIELFKSEYSWLGEQYAKEFLLCVAANSLQRYISRDTRIRSHLLLFWEKGWLKSTFMLKSLELLGVRLATIVNDITKAVLRGTLEIKERSHIFIPPLSLTSRYIFIDELGSITTSDELVQLLLTILETGLIGVNLAKLARLSEEERAEIAQEYNIIFDKNNPATMYYKSNTSFIVSTYNPKYVHDDAFASRFEVIIPQQRLDNQLIEYTDKNRNRCKITHDFAQSFKEAIFSNPNFDVQEEWCKPLPEDLFSSSYDMTFRMLRSLNYYRIANLFWGIEVTKEDLLERLKYLNRVQQIVGESLEDKIIQLLRSAKQPLTYEEIQSTTKMPSKDLANVLLHSRCIQRFRSTEGVLYYYVTV